jgi:hypothetical protein
MKPTPLHPNASGNWIVKDPGDLFGRLIDLLPRTVDPDRIQTATMDIFQAAIADGWGPDSDWRPILQLVMAGYALADPKFEPWILL